jgi:hypothetical protein
VYEWIGDAIKTEYEKGGMILGPTSQKPIGIKQPTGELVSAHLAIMGGKILLAECAAHPLSEDSALPPWTV